MRGRLRGMGASPVSRTSSIPRSGGRPLGGPPSVSWYLAMRGSKAGSSLPSSRSSPSTGPSVARNSVVPSLRSSNPSAKRPLHSALVAPGRGTTVRSIRRRAPWETRVLLSAAPGRPGAPCRAAGNKESWMRCAPAVTSAAPSAYRKRTSWPCIQSHPMMMSSPVPMGKGVRASSSWKCEPRAKRVVTGGRHEVSSPLALRAAVGPNAPSVGRPSWSARVVSMNDVVAPLSSSTCTRRGPDRERTEP